MKNLIVISSVLLASCSVSVEGGGASDSASDSSASGCGAMGTGANGGSGGSGGSSSSNPTGPSVQGYCEEWCALMVECDFVFAQEQDECVEDCIDNAAPGCDAELTALGACQLALHASCDENVDYHACDAESDAYTVCSFGVPDCSTDACTNEGADDCSCQGQCGKLAIEQVCWTENAAGGSPEGTLGCDCYFDGQFTGAWCSQPASQCSIEGGCCRFEVDWLD